MFPFAPQVFSILFAAAFAGICGFLTKAVIQYQAVKTGMKCLLRIEIIHEHDHYMDKGYIPVYAMDNITESYGAYTALKGDGSVPKMVDDLKSLPSRKEDAKC